MKKLLAILFALVMVITMFAGCSAADNVNHNLSQAANNFQCLRKITVYNARTDLIVMEMEGYMSLSNNSTNELEIRQLQQAIQKVFLNQL